MRGEGSGRGRGHLLVVTPSPSPSRSPFPVLFSGTLQVAESNYATRGHT